MTCIVLKISCYSLVKFKLIKSHSHHCFSTLKTIEKKNKPITAASERRNNITGREANKLVTQLEIPEFQRKAFAGEWDGKEKEEITLLCAIIQGENPGSGMMRRVASRLSSYYAPHGRDRETPRGFIGGRYTYQLLSLSKPRAREFYDFTHSEGGRRLNATLPSDLYLVTWLFSYGEFDFEVFVFQMRSVYFGMINWRNVGCLSSSVKFLFLNFKDLNEFMKLFESLLNFNNECQLSFSLIIVIIAT